MHFSLCQSFQEYGKYRKRHTKRKQVWLVALIRREIPYILCLSCTNNIHFLKNIRNSFSYVRYFINVSKWTLNTENKIIELSFIINALNFHLEVSRFSLKTMVYPLFLRDTLWSQAINRKLNIHKAVGSEL